MESRRIAREGGSTLVMIVIFTFSLFALVAGLTMTSVVGARASLESDTAMRAFYVADSGAQIGIARVRASDGTAPAGTFTENLAGGSASVAIARPTGSLYQITSTGTYFGRQFTVELFIEYRSSFILSGGVSAMVGSGVEVDTNIPVDLLGASRISGKDHDSTGAPLADQSNAIYGLTMNRIAGSKNFAFSGTGTAEGVPSASTNNAPYMGTTLTALRNHARVNAPIQLWGSRVLGSADTGIYGTAAAPELVYVNLPASGYLEMGGTFAGHGTLVIDAGETNFVTTLRMIDSASWYGLVVVYFRDDVEVGSSGSVIRLLNDAKILGGMAIMFNGDEVEIWGSGKVIQTSVNASILHSSALLSSAPGTSADSATKTAEVTAYWRK